MTLEDQLIQTMIDAYKKKGVNLQSILDNPLFQGLSLAQKVKILESKAAEFSSAPKVSVRPFLEHTGLSAISGALAVATKSAIAARKPSGMSLAAGALVGGLLGAGMSIKPILSGYKRDIATANAVRDNKYIEAIVNRSNSAASTIPKTNKIMQSLVKLEDKSYDVIHTIDKSK